MRNPQQTQWLPVDDIFNSLGVQPTHGQPKPEPGDRAQARLDALTRELAKEAHATIMTAQTARFDRGGGPTDVLRCVRPTTTAVVSVVVAVSGSGRALTGGGECVREDARHVGGGDAAALVADA